MCPGSFDPPTAGHLDIIGRAAGLFDRVTVAVLVNPANRACSPSRNGSTCCRAVTADRANVDVDSFGGLLVDYCTSHHIQAIVKGLRAVSDFDYELQMAQMNKGLSGVDTLFMPTSPGLQLPVVVAGQTGGDVRR